MSKKFNISSYEIKSTQKVFKALKIFDKNNCDLAIVVNKYRKFLGIITSADIRRGFLNGLTLKSSISNIFNKSPLFIKGTINEDKISDLISSKKFSHINPGFIPLINNDGKVYDLIKKDDIYNYPKKRIVFSRVPLKILVIGGAGYIGSVLIEKLLSKKFEVILFDKFIYKDIEFFKKKYKHKNLKIINGDSQNISKIFSAINESDAVIHLAELVGDPLCEKRPSKTYAINYLASITIGNICKNLGIDKFIYVSSCSVYGANTKITNERSPINPLSIYAKLKALCEKNLIRNLGENIRPCILRLGTVYGASDRPRYDLVVNLFSGLIANKKEITINGGKQWRPFIHVKDVADAIIKVINSDKKMVNGQIMNLVSENIQIAKIGKIIKSMYPKAKIKYEHSTSDHRDYRASNKKAKKMIKFKPNYRIIDGIKEVVLQTKKEKIKKLFDKKYINILNYTKF